MEDTAPLPGGPADCGSPADTSTAAKRGPAEQDKELIEKPLSLEFHGYIDNVVQFENLLYREPDWLLNANRATFRVSGQAGRLVDFSVGVVNKFYSGSTNLDLVPFMPSRVRQTLLPSDPLTGRKGVAHYLHSELSNDLYLQEAFGTLHLGEWFVRAGRQRFSTGTGYSFNPTDLFNRKNPIDPTYEIDGADIVAVGFSRSSRKAEFLVKPSASRSPDWFARGETPVGSWRWAFQYTSIIRPRMDWEAMNTIPGLLLLENSAPMASFERESRWRQAAAEFKREFGDSSFYGEMGFAFIDKPVDAGTLADDERSHERILLGIERRFSSGAEVILEYMRLGQAQTADEFYMLNDLVAYYTGEILSRDKDTLFGQISYRLFTPVEICLKTTSSLNHHMTNFNPWIYVDLARGLQFSVSGYVMAFSEENQYGKCGPGGYVRLRFDF